MLIQIMYFVWYLVADRIFITMISVHGVIGGIHELLTFADGIDLYRYSLISNYEIY